MITKKLHFYFQLFLHFYIDFNRLTNKFGKKYTPSLLYKIKQFYNIIEKVPILSGKLTWSHYTELLSIKDSNKLSYYINTTKNNSLSKRELREKIKNKEYERLPIETKNKFANSKNIEVKDLVPNNKNNIEIVTEKALHIKKIFK